MSFNAIDKKYNVDRTSAEGKYDFDEKKRPRWVLIALFFVVCFATSPPLHPPHPGPWTSAGTLGVAAALLAAACWAATALITLPTPS